MPPLTPLDIQHKEFTKAMRGFIKQQARFRHGPE